MNEVLQSSAAALYVKLIIDVWRYYNKSNDLTLPGWFWATATLALGVAFAGFINLADGGPFTGASVAQIVLNGVLAAAQAIGVTEMQKRG